MDTYAKLAERRTVGRELPWDNYETFDLEEWEEAAGDSDNDTFTGTITR